MVTEISNKEKFNEKKNSEKRETTKYEQKFYRNLVFLGDLRFILQQWKKAEVVSIIPEVL